MATLWNLKKPGQKSNVIGAIEVFVRSWDLFRVLIVTRIFVSSAVKSKIKISHFALITTIASKSKQLWFVTNVVMKNTVNFGAVTRASVITPCVLSASIAKRSNAHYSICWHSMQIVSTVVFVISLLKRTCPHLNAAVEKIVDFQFA